MTHFLITPILIAVFVLIIFSFFFSLSETALIALNKIRLKHMVKEGNKKAKRVYKIVTNLDKLIGTILVGNNFVNTAISAIGTAGFVYLLGPNVGVIVSTVVVTLFLLVFCEITPKILAMQHTERISLLIAKPMAFIIQILSPIVRVVVAVSNSLIRLFGGEPKARSPLITEEEIKVMLEVGKEEGVLAEEEHRMLHQIFKFGDTEVGAVMVPFEDMISISSEATADELLNVITEEGHSRIPAYDKEPKRIIGFILAKDLLYLWRANALIIIKDIIHPIHYVSPKMKVNDLLLDFQRLKMQIAIVVNDKKEAIGLVTLEDLLEEIVGEIDEDYDQDLLRGEKS